MTPPIVDEKALVDDELYGEVATAIIEDLDIEIKTLVKTEDEWDVWASLATKIKWRNIAYGAVKMYQVAAHAPQLDLQKIIAQMYALKQGYISGETKVKDAIDRCIALVEGGNKK